MTVDRTLSPATLDERLRLLLPETYQDSYEKLKPVPMGSAALKRGEDGTLHSIAQGYERPIAFVDVNGALLPITHNDIGSERNIQREPWFCPC